MKLINRICSAALLVATVFALSSCAPDSPEVLSFAFTKSKNSALTKTYEGVVDTDLHTITVALPESIYTDSTVRASLKPTIVLDKGATLVTNVNSLDFSKSPVSLVITTKKSDSTYHVYFEKEHAAVSVGQLLITEYYSGDEFQYKGGNNQYIEISNMSAKTIDLGAVELTRHTWKNGIRCEKQDQTVRLSGTLPSGASAVIYCNRSRYFSESDSTASKLFLSDARFNSIISFSSQDGIELTCNGKVLDSIGPENGYGNGWNWGAAKKMQRKATVKTYKKFNENEWIVSSVTNDKSNDSVATTAGVITSPVASDKKEITYFALEGTPDIIYGRIDNENKTVKVNIPMTYGTVHKITASTNGQKVRLVEGSKKYDIVAGETETDLSKNVKLLVLDNAGGNVEYSVICNVVNYKFNNNPNGTYSELNTAPADGDVVLIYYPAGKYVMGSTASGTKLAAVSAEVTYDGLEYEDGMASVTVTVDNDGYYTFTWNKKYLTAPATANGVSFAENPSDYSLWRLESAGNGMFYIVNVNAKRFEKGDSALEYYSGFSTYNNYTSTVYKLKFYKK